MYTSFPFSDQDGRRKHNNGQHIGKRLKYYGIHVVVKIIVVIYHALALIHLYHIF